MKSTAKDVTVLVLAIIALMTFMFGFNARTELNKYKRNFEREMALRLDMEEKVNRFSSERVGMMTQIKNNALEIEKKDATIVQLSRDSETQQERTEELSKQLEQMTLLKEQLEENLKEALVKQSPQRR